MNINLCYALEPTGIYWRQDQSRCLILVLSWFNQTEGIEYDQRVVLVDTKLHGSGWYTFLSVPRIFFTTIFL